MSQDPTDDSELPQDPDATLGPDIPMDPDATIAAGPADPAAVADHPGVIGPYRIGRRLGEGGMGEVFLAEQTEPIKRSVALKIIKPGMDTRAVVARFELERQTLALMNHPGIARVYDAGQTEQGRPYFVMEFVEGVPINHYCDSKRLTTRQRLALVMDVCTAVQHAHQKAVIHRDLKPGNILITEIDGKPMPKVIDFGIARATEQRDAERTMFTQVGHVIGTPAYMSPEQTDPTNSDIDTRTDIYSLGVVLYELLVGLTPFDTASVYSAGYEAIMKFVREQEAPRPSLRLQHSAAHTTGVAKRHHTESGKLVRTLQGDLDWILLKALEKDRGRRYETANALAMDIRRYLNDEPVLASPPSAGYLARKFVKRHRGGVIVGALTAVVLVAFALTTSLQNRVIRQERDRAELESAKATALTDFMGEMLVSVDPWASGEHDLTVAEAMDRSRAGVDSVFAAQPLVAAEMHATMGQAYLGLQKLTEAEEEVRLGLELRTAALGPDHEDVADGWLFLARIQRFNVQSKEAIDSGRESVRIRELHLPADDPQRLIGYADLIENYVQDRQFVPADSMLSLVDNIIAGSQDDLRAHAAAMLNLRARIASEERTDLAAADSLYVESIRLLRAKDPDAPLLTVYLNNAAVNQMTMQDYVKAEATYGDALAMIERQFGTDHPKYALVLENLGGIAFRQGNYDECLANLNRVKEIRSSNMGDTHPTVLRTMLNMATVASASGNPEKAVEIFDEVLPRLISVNGEDHLDTATTLRNLGLAQDKLERFDEAAATFQRSRRAYVKLVGEKHHQTARTDSDLALTRMKQGRWQEAEFLALRGFDVFIEVLEPGDVRIGHVAKNLVRIYEELDQPQAAEKFRAHVLSQKPSE